MQPFHPPTRTASVLPIPRHTHWTRIFVSNTCILMLGFIFLCILFLLVNFLSFPVNRYPLSGLLVLFVPNFLIGLAQSRLFLPQLSMPFALISSVSWPISFFCIMFVVIFFDIFSGDELPISTVWLELLTIFLAGSIVGFGQGRVLSLPRTHTFRWVGINIAGYLFVIMLAHWFDIIQ